MQNPENESTKQRFFHNNEDNKNDYQTAADQGSPVRMLCCEFLLRYFCCMQLTDDQMGTTATKESRIWFFSRLKSNDNSQPTTEQRI